MSPVDIEEIDIRKSRLSSAKRALLERLLDGQVADDSEALTIPRRARHEAVPLSLAQQRLWLNEQLHPETSAYNLPFAFRLSGALNVPALKQATGEIAKRHESLRTSFELLNGKPVQVISEAHKLDFKIIDLRSLPQDKREPKARDLVLDEARHPFDLRHGPLIRMSLMRLAEHEYIASIVMHHIICDGWSLRVFRHEMTLLYEAFSRGEKNPLAELPIQYADFAGWQRQSLEAETPAGEIRYWKQQLDGAPPVLDLPTDRPRPDRQSFDGASESFLLEVDLPAELERVCRQRNATLFMVLHAAFNVLLYRYAGQQDIVVGIPIAGRDRKETEGLIGFFVNSLPIRTRPANHYTFDEFLKQVREVILDAHAHQTLPFEKIVEELSPDRNLSHAPLFQVMFSFEHESQASGALRGLAMSEYEADSGSAKFDLTLSMIEAEGNLGGAVEYSTDLFEQATVQRMIGHFRNLLEAVASKPGACISELPLLSEDERNLLLTEWNRTDTEYPEGSCIQELFETTVKRSSDAISVESAQIQITYGELNRRSNQLANHLRGLGVRPDTLVGICLETSVEMIIGLLGILKAGGAYVPLDPSYPAQRLARIIEDADPVLLITREHLSEKLSTPRVLQVWLDHFTEIFESNSVQDIPSLTAPDNLAYVMYTSGSTGHPKGICIPHRAVNRLVINTNYVGLNSSDSVAQVSSFSFDAATFEIWGALLNSARLVMISKDVAVSPKQFAQRIKENAITTLFLTTALFNQMARAVPGAFESVRNLLFGGEAVDPRWVRQMLKNDSPQRLLHMYGPTETTTFATCHLVEDQMETPATVSIGKPISNTRVYLLDTERQPAPVGVTGEIYIGGDGLARAYLNSPDLTADVFTPHPFATQLGSRLYRTGDRARYLAGGDLEFVGRIDQQVKIRGFRIEPAEIEAVLKQHPGLTNAVVTVRDDRGHKRLIAYVVVDGAAPVSVPALRDFVKTRLPDYMTPSAFVVVESIHLTSNGKIDYRSLPAPDMSEPISDYVEPRTLSEKAFATIWAEVLGAERVGINDNFFDLGGDSILCIQTIARASLAGLHITAKQLFQHQTIAELAVVAASSKSFNIQQEPVTGQIPLTPIQHWFFEQDPPHPHHFNLALMLELREPIDPAVLTHIVYKLLEHHDGLCTHYEFGQGGWQQINRGPEKASPPLEINLANLPEGEKARAIQAAADELHQSLSLTEGPLVRVALFNLGAFKTQRLLIVIHHLVIDWVSWRVLLEDLERALRQSREGEEIILPPKTTSFMEWSQRLTQYAETETVERELNYWLSKWRKASESLPVDYPEGVNDVASARIESVYLSKEQTRTLLQDAPPILDPKNGV